MLDVKWEPPYTPLLSLADPTVKYVEKHVPFEIPSHKPIAPFKPTHMETLNPPNEGDIKFNKCDREVVAFMAIDSSKKWTRNQIALGSGYSAGSGGFANTLSRLWTAGILKGSGKELGIDITTAITVLGGIPKADKNVSQVWESNLNKCEREIWKYLEQKDLT